MNYARIILFLLTSYLTISYILSRDSYTVDLTEDLGDNQYEMLAQTIPERPKPFHRFFFIMGKLESNNDYLALNRFGYRGKYQFATSTLRHLKSKGYLSITDEEIVAYRYLKTIQERSMVALTYHNIDVLKRYGLMRYIGNYVGGVKISLYGMLAGAHLVGPRAVNKYIKSNGRLIAKDGNGTTIVKYMNKFAI